MNVLRKALFPLTVILLVAVTVQAYSQLGRGQRPDSLVERVNLDTLPLNAHPAVERVLNNITGKPYTKDYIPINIKNIRQNLLSQPKITLTIPGLGRQEFTQKTIAWRDSTHYRWQGKSINGNYNLKLVVNEQKLTGTFSTDTASYRIQPAGDITTQKGVPKTINLHVISRMDPSGLHLVDSLSVGTGKSQSSPQKLDIDKSANQTEQVRQDKTEHGILVVYSDEVASNSGDPEGLVRSAVSDANSAYENSDIPLELSLVYTREVDYNESSDTDTDLERLVDPSDGFIDEVHQYRKEYGGDLVVLLVANSQSTEAGTVTGEAYKIMADSANAFAVVRYDFAEAPVYTLAHEVGHLQGADHNPDDEIGPYKAYGHGYVNSDAGWRTIMAYNKNGCCSRIEFFSNPDVIYNNEPLGTESNNDNARVIEETGEQIAGFLPPFPLEVKIDGPSYVGSGEKGNWQADISGGISPYTYSWYYREDQQQSWQWVSDSSAYSRVVQQQFELKLVTEDGSGDKKSTQFDIFTDVKSDIPGSEPMPSRYRLYPNYPNPFNPSTKIRYQLPDASRVMVTVYNVMGQKVETLVSDLQPAGMHRVTFSPDSKASGIYILRLKARSEASGTSFSQTMKMVFMK